MGVAGREAEGLPVGEGDGELEFANVPDPLGLRVGLLLGERPAETVAVGVAVPVWEGLGAGAVAPHRGLDEG